MEIVDREGRIFGRFNVVDAVVTVFVLGLIPLLYGAVVLFRVPPPKLTAVVPAAIAAGPSQRVTIKGENLRPYMRVSFGTNQGQNFLFKSITEAVVDLHEMPPGVYDVVLYDVAQEQSRLPGGFTVLPSPLAPTQVILVGMLGNLDLERAKQIKVGDRVSGVGTIRALGVPLTSHVRINSSSLLLEIPMDKAVMLPAEVETSCDLPPKTGLPFCVANDTSLQPTVVLMGQHPVGRLPFQIDQVRSPAALESIDVIARYAGPRDIMRAIRKNDVDLGLFANPLAAGAKVVDVRAPHSLDPTTDEVIVTIRLQAERGSNGWVYAGLPVRAGGNLAVRNARYEVSGLVLSITPEWAPPQ
jgi:IPT/TIG domain